MVEARESWLRWWSLEEGQPEVGKYGGEGVPRRLRALRRRSLRHRPHRSWRETRRRALLAGELSLWRKLRWRLDKLLLLLPWNCLWSSWGGQLWQLGQAVHVDCVCSLVSLVANIDALLGGNQVDQLVGILAHNHRPEVTSDVVPIDPIAVLVVEHRQAGLVVELLQPLDGDADVVLGLDGPLLDSLVIVRLRNSSLSSGRPGSLWVRGVCRSPC